MIMSRTWAMPNSNTFKIPQILGFVQKYLLKSTISIDPFARNTRLATYRNDLSPDTSAQYHMDALEFLNLMEGKEVDLVIFDPPYSIHQCRQVYDSMGLPVTQRDCQVWGRWKEHKDILAKMINPNGVSLSFGWNSGGFGKKRGFEIEEILLVCHGSAHNDTICLAERKQATEPNLFQE